MTPEQADALIRHRVERGYDQAESLKLLKEILALQCGPAFFARALVYNSFAPLRQAMKLTKERV